MSKQDSINQLLLHELAAAINREVKVEDALITVTYVEVSPDLKQAHVGFSILPDNQAGTALRRLSSSTSDLVAILRKRTRLRKIPRLIWEFDATEKDAGRLEKLIREANEEDNN